MPRRLVALILACVAGVIAVGVVVWAGDEPKTRADYCGPARQVEQTPRLGEDPRTVTPGYERVASVALALAVAEVPDGRLLVATKDGHLWQVPAGGGPAVEVLDLSSEVATDTEQGLLGIAIPREGALVYLYATLSDQTARIVEFGLTAEGIDPARRRDVLVVEDPHPSHNGGRLAFDAEGMLMLGIGDRGDGDRTGAAQDLGSLFGKLLRIDPMISGDDAYGIPADNPYVGRPGAREEIWAYGLRNPWGWDLDAATDELWVGDAGQLCFEELSTAPEGGKGRNFAWPHLEGAHEFRGPVLGPDGEPEDVPIADVGPLPKRRVGPLLEYAHGPDRCSVLGGVVYRGTALPELNGTYLWADLCERAVHTLRRLDGRWVAGTLGGEVPAGIVSFARSADGEVYLVSLDQGVFQLKAPSGV